MKLVVDISVSLDGYVAGPDPSEKEPLGIGGEDLHEWVVATKTWRKRHGKSGGNAGVDADMADAMAANTGASIMGRKMFSGGTGPWESDSNADGWWGDAPPFKHSVFVLTHHPRETVTKQNGTSYVFVNDGPESALAQARKAAGKQDVLISGGGNVIQQYLPEVDEMRLHIVPILLGGGAPLFGSGHSLQKWTLVASAESPTGVLHATYHPQQ
jgi:dihydrofolate reductase